jgi:hypothetical protein
VGAASRGRRAPPRTPRVSGVAAVASYCAASAPTRPLRGAAVGVAPLPPIVAVQCDADGGRARRGAAHPTDTSTTPAPRVSRAASLPATGAAVLPTGV